MSEEKYCRIKDKRERKYKISGDVSKLMELKIMQRVRERKMQERYRKLVCDEEREYEEKIKEKQEKGG